MGTKDGEDVGKTVGTKEGEEYLKFVGILVGLFVLFACFGFFDGLFHDIGDSVGYVIG